MGLCVPLVLILLFVLASGSGALLSSIARESTEPAETVTIAETATIAGLRVTLSINDMYVNPASSCEYATPPPGTRRIAADVTLTPAGLERGAASVQFFGLIDTGECRYSLRLPDDGSDGTTRGSPIGRSNHASIVSDVADTPGWKYSLERIPDGLMGRIAYERIDDAVPAAV